MYNVVLENQLIVVDIVDTMQDYVSLQPDIDSSKVKAASIVAQKIDIKRVIGAANILRCVDPQTEADEELKDLVIPTLCYFTYTRMLKMFQGAMTDSGFTLDPEATDKDIAKSVAAEHKAIAEAFLQEVIDFLEAETPDDENVDDSKMTPSIRVFGGNENRASN